MIHVPRHGSGLAALSEDQLIGVISAARRMESRAAWTQLAAVREFAARRPDRDRTGVPRAGFSEFAADELVAEFNLSWPSAAEQIAFACQVAERLPRTFAALAAGQIHPVHVKIIEDETRVLSPEDAAKADEVLAEAARSKSFGELRYAAHRLVLKLDPDSAQRRKDEAKKEAHVGGPQGSPSGTGGNGTARQPGRDNGPSVAALVNITVPLSTLLGLSATPGDAAGFGLLDAQTLSARSMQPGALSSPVAQCAITPCRKRPFGKSA